MSDRARSPRTWRGGHRGFKAGYQAYFWVLKTLGRRPVQWALVPLVAFYWLFLGAQRAGLDAYLRRRFPASTRLDRARYRFRILLNFAWSLVDRVHALLPGPTELELDRSAVPGLKDALYDTEEARERGFLMLSGHLGNADLAGMLLGGKQRRVNVLLYRDPDDPFFEVLEEAMGDEAPRFIAINHDGRMASLDAVRAMRRGEVVAAKGDRAVDGRFATVDFLGGRIRVPTGPLLLAAMARTPVLFTGCFKTGPNTYRFEADGPHDFQIGRRDQRDAELARWAAHWAKVMEGWTEKYPLQWYNFFDPWAVAEGSPPTAPSSSDEAPERYPEPGNPVSANPSS